TVFPPSRLTAAVALACLHAVSDAVRDASDGANLSRGQIIQLFQAGAIDAAVAAHPEVAAVVFENARDDIIKQTFPGRDARELPIFEASESTPISANPQGAISILVDF